jgi:FtsZ-binding cell division protein ZapB
MRIPLNLDEIRSAERLEPMIFDDEDKGFVDRVTVLKAVQNDIRALKREIEALRRENKALADDVAELTHQVTALTDPENPVVPKGKGK